MQQGGDQKDLKSMAQLVDHRLARYKVCAAYNRKHISAPIGHILKPD